MINEEKVILMTKASLYENKEKKRTYVFCWEQYYGAHATWNI